MVVGYLVEVLVVVTVGSDGAVVVVVKSFVVLVVADVVVEGHEGKMSTSTNIAMGYSTGNGTLASSISKVSLSCSYLYIYVPEPTLKKLSSNCTIVPSK